MMIEDGTGSGRKAGVDANNRVQSFAVSISSEQANAFNGKTFNVNTGNITLTSGTESAVLYLENTGILDLHIPNIGYLIGNSTGGSGDILATVLRNPTAGTIVSNAVATPIKTNKNFGSSDELNASAYKGVEGDTLTDGEDAFYSLIPGDARGYIIATGVIILPRGASIGIKFTPQTGNTSMDLQVFMSVTEYDLD